MDRDRQFSEIVTPGKSSCVSGFCQHWQKRPSLKELRERTNSGLFQQ
jgi:hypothetical protein